MQFALIEGVRATAAPKTAGQCPACGAAMIAKCGTRKIWHWAHKVDRTCDPWWEPETLWHRTWKNNFPPDWQEQIGHDPSGEKHIADVRTPHGMVIEFQHSHLDPAERAARERYYGNMVWVVDGARLKRDFPRFIQGLEDVMATPLAGVMRTQFPHECFPRNWLESNVPVIFDFGGVEDEAATPDQKQTLWCLLPGRINGDSALLGRYPRSTFVEILRSKPQLIDARSILEVLTEHYRLARQANMARAHYQLVVRYPPRRPYRGRRGRPRF